MSVCVVCKAPSEKKCSLCQSVFYCSREHQKQDWKNHKSKCIAYKIEECPELGRYLVAKRKIPAGQEILTEEAIVSGPLQHTPPVCLGCYRLLTSLGSIECSRCGWPMCSIECATKSQHSAECRITLQNRGSKVTIHTFELPHPSYGCLTVLRCLHMKKNNPKNWEKLSRLQSHCEQRKLTDQYEKDKINIAQFIRRFFKFEEFSEDEIMRIVGIININGHEVPISGHDFVSVFENASYLEHNCRANCSKSFTSSGDLVIRAATTIEPGQHLTICYTDPLWGTQARREHLATTKFFSCTCERCSDPTECGSYFSAISCLSRECKGYTTSMNPLDLNSSWKCNKCEAVEKYQVVNDIISEATGLLASSDKNSLPSLMSCIDKLAKKLHPNHYLMTDAKLSVTQLLDENVGRLSDENLTIKLNFCQHLYKLTKNLVPAENRCIGVLLFGLHAALAETGRRRSNRREIDQFELINNLLECKEILSESYKLLRFEPPILPEGEIAVQAKANLNDIEKILQTLHKTIGDAPV